MGKRPPKNAAGGGKKKKRSRVQRDYDDGEDVMVESGPVKGRGGLRETQKRTEALRTRWMRVKEANFQQQQAKRFEKPAPKPKPKGLTQAQRRTRRRRAAIGEAPARSWPTKREIKALQAGGGDSFQDAAAALGLKDGEAELEGEEEEDEEEEEVRVVHLHRRTKKVTLRIRNEINMKTVSGN